MDVYELARLHLLELSAVRAWPDMRAVIMRATDHRNRHWRVPALACAAVGGAEQAAAVMAAIACLHTSIILIDDLLDADPRGEYHRLGMPAAANLAVAFQALGLEVLGQAPASGEARLAAQQSLNQAALQIAFGQQMDCGNPANEQDYWRVVEAKSSPFFSAAMHMGALLGGATPALAEQLRQLGHLYGEMIQIYDDVNDTLAAPANQDWVLGRRPLPILFAELVEHPERERFLALRAQLSERADAETLQEAQAIVINCGGISFSVHALLRRHALAVSRLETLTLPNRSVLDGLFQDVVRPVHHLLEAVSGAA